jgi:hypothetical protein
MKKMKTLEQLSKEAASALIFESVDTPQIEITISNPKSEDAYTIKVPKMFLEEFAKLAAEQSKPINFSDRKWLIEMREATLEAADTPVLSRAWSRAFMELSDAFDRIDAMVARTTL